jgi:hypothetical protein
MLNPEKVVMSWAFAYPRRMKMALLGPWYFG